MSEHLNIPPQNKKAIVTIAIGKKYQKIFDLYCRDNWQAYCDKFGYDLIVLTEPLDLSERSQKRSPSWQKLLILSQEWSSNYDRIVWIDTDIIINNTYAYDICKDVPIEKVGAVEAFSIPNREIHEIAILNLYDSWEHRKLPYIRTKRPSDFCTLRGFDEESYDMVVQGGVFVCSPKYHRDIFEYIYYNFEDTHGPEWNYEMPALSYNLVKADMVYWISPRFNFSVMDLIAGFYPNVLKKHSRVAYRVFHRTFGRLPFINTKEIQCLRSIYKLSIFMHFAGTSNMMGLHKKITQ